MRSLAWGVVAVTAACSAPATPRAPVANQIPSPRSRRVEPCPEMLLADPAALHELFPACPPAPFEQLPMCPDGDCGSPCTSSALGDPGEEEIVSTWALSYDAAKRWVSSRGTSQDAIEWRYACSYGGDGRVTRCDSRYSAPPDPGQSRTFTRDASGRITAVTTDDAQVTQPDTSIEYSARGEVSAVIIGGARDELGYDAAHRLVELRTRSSDTRYSYDAQGRVAQARYADRDMTRSTTYVYDAAGRLASTVETTPYGRTTTTLARDDRARVTRVTTLMVWNRNSHRTGWRSYAYCD